MPRMQRSYVYAVLILLLSVVPDAIGQKVNKGPRFTRLKENAQLSNLTITCTYQDSKGWLWVGTQDGLNRFDGYEFKVYRNIEGDSTTLFKNSVHAIFEDRKGRLWVATLNSGLQYYNRELDLFQRVPEFSRNHCQVRDIMEDFDHNVWIGGVIDLKAFIAKLDAKTNQWTIYHLFDAEEGIYCMVQDTQDEFWLGSRTNGLINWNSKTQKIEKYLHDPSDNNSLPGNYIEDIVKDNTGNIWIGTRYEGVCKFQRDKNNFKRFFSGKNTNAILKNDIMDLCVDNDFLWIGIENGGVSRLDTRNEVIENYSYKKDDPTTIINNSIWSLYKDNQERIWVGSYAKGLCVLDRQEKNFYDLNLDLENDLINSILRDSKGRLWVGGEDGLLMIDNDRVVHYRHNAADKSSLSADPVQTIFEDHKHRIWIGCWSGGINLYDEDAKNFVRYLPDGKPTSLKDPNVFTINETKEGELLVCTFHGLHVMKNVEKGIFENVLDNPQEGDLMLLTVMEDHANNVWVGAFSGLGLYDLKTKKVKRISLGNNPDNIGDRVNCIYEDSHNRLWIGSSAGLFQMKAPDEFVPFTEKDGLPVNNITTILEDSHGNLWLGTTHGIVVFDPAQKVFRTFNREDGLNSVSIRERAAFQDKNGYIYVGGNGVNVFHPDSIFSNAIPPPIYITDLRILNQSIRPNAADNVLNKTISETNEITLNHDHGIISLHYVGLNYTASAKNKYAYKLEGFDQEWNYASDVRFATYTSLDPGKYVFQVKASNNDGVWNEEGASLIINILPPWWATWWFRAFFAAAIVGMFILIYYIRTRNIRRINRTQEEIIHHRTHQLQEINKALMRRELEIESQNKKLKDQAEELSAQNDELTQNQEEISSQRDLVFHQNQKLLETQKIIEQHNEILETEIVNRTKELVEYNHQLEQFAFISAHNLRSPVARIIGLGNLLSRSENKIEEKEQIYPKLVHAAGELDQVIKDLNTILDLKKNNDLFLTEVDLETEVNMIKDNLEHEIMQTGAIVITNFGQLRIIRTVKPYMDSILYNLISNAIKYRHSGRTPEIHLNTENLEKEICVCVKDNGLGIDTSLFHDKIFTLYSRFHTHVEGKGMGLYLVKTQVTALGGRIEINSQVDSGTMFRIYFPKHN